MPSLTLKHLWLHRADDYETFITFDGGTEAVRRAKQGETRQMADGSVRSITQAGTMQVLEVTCPRIDQATFDTLEAWVIEGALLMLRDAKRRVCWGNVFEINGQVFGATEETVSFTFHAVTFDESV